MPRDSKSSTLGLDTGREKSAERFAFVERLQLIVSYWPSADRLARAVGVSPSAFRKWLKGEAEPSRERLVALAHAAGVGIAWLAEGKGPTPDFSTSEANRPRSGGREQPAAPDWRQFELLPDRSPRGATGQGNPVRSAANGWIALHHDWIRSVCGVEPRDLLLEIATGEAMTPTIRKGSALLVDTTDRISSNSGIFVLEINGRRIVRRVQRKHDDALVLISDNK